MMMMMMMIMIMVMMMMIIIIIIKHCKKFHGKILGYSWPKICSEQVWIRFTRIRIIEGQIYFVLTGRDTPLIKFTHCWLLVCAYSRHCFSWCNSFQQGTESLCHINPLNAKLNPICHLLALFGAHHILHVSRIRVKSVLKTLSLLRLFKPFQPSNEVFGFRK